ncbi:TetR/AcrR family transcriptional regulator [Streptacidiphilus sp. N1-12]|uniref:TetR/AcrR family transcriptional regulator n=2 Tax=Streptacidiphilus alkalitolerans TaxID=3342712 RepID=A0ABV6V4R1_9ACTN
MPRPPDEGTTAPSRRRRNQERTRERIYATAVLLFSRKGYADTSVAEIAACADIGRGTFFNYFAHKDCLISAWTQDRLRKLDSRVTGRLRGGAGTAEALYAYMTALGDLNEEEPELSAAMLTAWIQAGWMAERRPELGAVFAGVVERGLVRGDVSGAVSPERVGDVLWGLYVGALHRWAGRAPDRRRGLLDTELRLGVQLLLNGLAPTSARL